MSVTVYSTPDCQQCRMTKYRMRALGIEPVEVDLSTDPDAYAKVTQLGYMQAPVVITDSGDHWSGFQPDKIKALVAA